MEKPKRHIFVCGSFRVAGEPKGICHRKESGNLLPYLEAEVSDRGLDDVMVSSAGCMKMCEKGPVMVVYPDAHWYGELDEDKIDEILDAMEEGHSADSLRLA